MTLDEFQAVIERTYGARDEARGLPLDFLWFVEEVGELSRAVRAHLQGRVADANLAEEFADVLAWLASLASRVGLELGALAEARYGVGCPRCGACPCACPQPPPLG